MAIVLNTTPASFSSAHEDILFVAYEATKATDPVTYPDYRYVCDVYEGATIRARLKAVPHPTHNRGVFNIGPIVRSLIVQPVLIPNASFTLEELNHSVDITCKFGEEYGGTTYTNLLTDSERIYYNNYNSLIGDYADKFQTTRPYATKLFTGVSNYYISIFGLTVTTIDYEIKTYNIAGTLLNTYNPTGHIMTAAHCFLANISITMLTSLGVSFTGVDYITIETDIDGTIDIKRFDIACEAKYENRVITFLNKLGGFESFVFNKVSKKSIDIERKGFTQLPYRIDDSGGVSYKTYENVHHEQATTFATSFKQKQTLNSDLLTDAEFTWLSELIVSPSVYLEENGEFYPVKITNSNYDFKKAINDKLNNLTITVEFGNQLNSQYR